ncbi:MAG: rhomboid family intramembrane serine protease [Flavobacteriaceae bacterium]
MSTLNRLVIKFKSFNVIEQIIVLNVGVFILSALFGALKGDVWLIRYLELPRDVFDLIYQPWSILTYGFVHYDFFHLLFNMLVLHYIARILFNLFQKRLILNIYLLGIIFGGMAYLLVYNLFDDSYLKSVGVLVGASAGVRALLIFLCVYLPDNEVRILSFNIKLLYIALVMIGFDFLGLVGANQGGNIAHLGGALLGYLYAVQFKNGKDLGSGFDKFVSGIVSVFKTKSPLKTVHKRASKSSVTKSAEFSELNKQKQIDLILDKISKSGYESLTKEEKEFLFRAGK